MLSRRFDIVYVIRCKIVFRIIGQEHRRVGRKGYSYRIFGGLGMTRKRIDFPGSVNVEETWVTNRNSYERGNSSSWRVSMDFDQRSLPTSSRRVRTRRRCRPRTVSETLCIRLLRRQLSTTTKTTPLQTQWGTI